MIQKRKQMMKLIDVYKMKMKKEDHFQKVKLNKINNYLQKNLEQEKYKIDLIQKEKQNKIKLIN